MLRDNLVELIEPMLNSAGADPLALYIHTRTPASDDRLPCLKNPRPEGAESSLTESASSPFQAEPAHPCARGAGTCGTVVTRGSPEPLSTRAGVHSLRACREGAGASGGLSEAEGKAEYLPRNKRCS